MNLEHRIEVIMTRFPTHPLFLVLLRPAPYRQPSHGLDLWTRHHGSSFGLCAARPALAPAREPGQWRRSQGSPGQGQSRCRCPVGKVKNMHQGEVAGSPGVVSAGFHCPSIVILITDLSTGATSRPRKRRPTLPPCSASWASPPNLIRLGSPGPRPDMTTL